MSIAHDEFEKTGHVIKADESGRVSLGAEVKDKLFQISQNKAGQILLTPVVLISEYEMWLWHNPEALTSVQRGLEDAAAGRGTVMDFSQYADLEIDE